MLLIEDNQLVHVRNAKTTKTMWDNHVSTSIDRQRMERNQNIVG